MPIDDRLERLRARATRALGAHRRVADAVMRVRAIIGPANIPDSEPLAQSALDKMHQGEQPTAAELTALEIVVRLMRPVLFSRDGMLDELPNPAGHDLYSQELQDAWSAFRERVRPFVPSIGRIERRDSTHIGTGFLVGDGVLATNRHVLGALTFGSEALSSHTARIVFKQEQGSTNSPADIVSIQGVTAIHPTLDMVLLAVQKDGRPPVDIEPTLATEGMQVAVIGFPAEDLTNNPLFLAPVFNGVYGKKRAALGEVLDGSVSPALFHDCSTTQGNSGSPVFSLATGRVTGIHRAGFFMYRNEAVDADALRRFIHSART